MTESSAEKTWPRRLLELQALLIRWVKKWWGVVVSLILTFFLVAEEARRNQPSYLPELIERLEYIYYDTRLKLLPKPTPSEDPPIIILDIDERSLATEGRWPWSRLRLAELNNALLDAGVYTITYDVFFSEPERNLALEMANVVSRSDPTTASLLALYEDETDYDQLFAQSVADANAVLGYVFYPGDETRVGTLPAPVDMLSPEDAEALTAIRAGGYVGNLKILQDAAHSGGLINPLPDLDGVIRRVPLMQRYDNALYSSLALSSVYNYYVMGMEEAVYHIGDGPAQRKVFEWVQIPADGTPHRIRTDYYGAVFVPYAGPQRTFTYVSATDVLNDNLTDDERRQLEGAIVLVGTSSIGLLDLRSTPLEPNYPGVEVHANVINGLLTNQIPYQLHNSYAYTALLMILLGLLFSLWFRRFGPVTLLSTTALCVLVVIAGNVYAWHFHYVNIPVANVLVLILVLGSFNMLEGFLRERASRQEVRSMFGQYVPSEYIDIMLNDPDSISFEGANKELTVLFSDIRSFTSISEQLSATQLKGLLNRYFTPITGIIFNRSGTIDKYVGDMVMAFWGAPLDDPQHAEHALEAAIDMINKTEELQSEFVADGLPAVEIGIGLNTGSMNVGDMGSEYRRSYTVLGDAVNLGSRLESLTKFYGLKVLVGPDTFAQCPNYFFRFIDKIMVKGKEDPIECYEPLCRKGEQSDELQKEIDQYNAAYQLYLQQDWQAASDAFAALLTTSTPQRSKLYTVYLGRIAELRTQELPSNWDGSYRHTSK
ncbi:MAG: adenylate/guanylate cyclase domain-containing protein [Natronospirillum sp.]